MEQVRIMAYNPRIDLWYRKYSAAAQAEQAGEKEKALLEEQRLQDSGSSPYNEEDAGVPWQEAKTRLPYGMGTLSAIAKNLMHKSGAAYTGNTQQVMDAVAKWGPSALNKTAGTWGGPKRYAWQDQLDPIQTQGYIAKLTAAVQNLPSLQTEWQTSTSNITPQTIKSAMADNSGGGMLMDDDAELGYSHLFD